MFLTSEQTYEQNRCSECIKMALELSVKNRERISPLPNPKKVAFLISTQNRLLIDQPSCIHEHLREKYDYAYVAHMTLE